MGEFIDRNVVKIGNETFESRHRVIATGAAPAKLNIPGETYLIASTRFMDMENCPNESFLWVADILPWSSRILPRVPDLDDIDGHRRLVFLTPRC